MKYNQYPPSAWHDRYRIQAKWTQAIRKRFYEICNFHAAQRILEVGSGTGVIISEIQSTSQGMIYGLDINPMANQFAFQTYPGTVFITGDGHVLPFTSATFDLVLSHFLLLWVSNPNTILSEMRRVTKPGGWLLVLAEPDYGGRIDHPPALAEVGKLQTKALQTQGADPWIGRKVRELFYLTGLVDIEVGVLGGEWHQQPSRRELESEWEVLAADLEGTVSQEALDELKETDFDAWKAGYRVLYVPTFYARGRVPI
jgi:ubiquinone/menaquinone biosynthesis C-methylase UbiE